MENKQTAVEWLVEKLQESGIPLMTDEFEMIQQAKEMEKEQIKEAYRSFNCFFPSEYNIDDEDCEKYFEQTYKPKKTFIDLVSDEESKVHEVVRKLKEKKK